MPTLLLKPTVIPAAGEPPKIIEEFVGRVNSRTSALSIARMTSPPGWREPGQTPEFDEYTVVLRGELQVQTRDKNYNVAAEQAIIVHAGEWVRYSTPQGAEYIAVCLPAFSPQTVHRAA
jgi:quercetin dioxygenase-like cupin family protein